MEGQHQRVEDAGQYGAVHDLCGAGDLIKTFSPLINLEPMEKTH